MVIAGARFARAFFLNPKNKFMCKVGVVTQALVNLMV